MSSPEDGAKAYSLAMKKSQAGDLEGAIKWARKALSIDPTLTKAKILLTSLERGHMPGYTETAGNGRPAESSSANRSATDGLRRRNHNESNEKASSGDGQSTPKREYTEEHVRIVTHVTKAGREHDYYSVLMLKKSDKPDDNAIKKGYRKLALQLHPDKNGAPGADEAFKIVSKAFTILSDPDKRAVHDRYGGDPDARGMRSSGGASHASAFGGGAPGFHAYGPGMGTEIDPNDLFNMFFGGGMGTGFGGTTFTFGGPGGVRMGQFGNGPFHARQTRQGSRTNQANDSTPLLLQLLPLILLGLFSLLTYAPALFSTPDPNYSFSPQGVYRQERMTTSHHVKYFVDPASWNTHPWVAAASRVAGSGSTVDDAAQATSKLQGFERRVENSYKNVLYNDCERRREYQARRVQAARGTLFGIGADREAEARIRAEKYESCDRLRDFGIDFTLNI